MEIALVDDADTPQLVETAFQPVQADALFPQERSTHAPRILILSGSLRARS